MILYNQRQTKNYSVFLLLFVVVLLLFSQATVHAAEVDPWKSFGVLQSHSKKAPDFTLPDLEGKAVSLSDLKGQVVFINFWATWCYACKIEMPSMDKLYRKYKNDGFVLLGIDLMEPKKKVDKFVKEMDITFPILLDSKGKLKKSYPMPGIPVTYLIDKKGNLRGSIFGSRKWGRPDAEALVLELLRE